MTVACSSPRAPFPPGPRAARCGRGRWRRRRRSRRRTGEAFLASATPAAGKTTFGLHVAHRLLSPGSCGASWWWRRRRTSAASGRPTRRATASTSSPTGPTPRARSRATATASPSPTRRSRPGRRCTGAGAREVPTLLIADEPHHMGEHAAWGRTAVDAFGAVRPAAAAVRHAVPLRQHADPVGRLRRRGRVARRLLVLVHAGARGPGVPAGDVLRLRRRHGVDVGRPPPARGLLDRAARGGGGAAAAHGAGSRRRLDGRGAARRGPAAGASCGPATPRTPAGLSSPPTRSTPTGWRIGSPRADR